MDSLNSLLLKNMRKIVPRVVKADNGPITTVKRKAAHDTVTFAIVQSPLSGQYSILTLRELADRQSSSAKILCYTKMYQSAKAVVAFLNCIQVELFLDGGPLEDSRRSHTPIPVFVPSVSLDCMIEQQSLIRTRLEAYLDDAKSWCCGIVPEQIQRYADAESQTESDGIDSDVNSSGTATASCQIKQEITIEMLNDKNDGLERAYSNSLCDSLGVNKEDEVPLTLDKVLLSLQEDSTSSDDCIVVKESAATNFASVCGDFEYDVPLASDLEPKGAIDDAFEERWRYYDALWNEAYCEYWFDYNYRSNNDVLRTKWIHSTYEGSSLVNSNRFNIRTEWHQIRSRCSQNVLNYEAYTKEKGCLKFSKTMEKRIRQENALFYMIWDEKFNVNVKIKKDYSLAGKSERDISWVREQLNDRAPIYESLEERRWQRVMKMRNCRQRSIEIASEPIPTCPFLLQKSLEYNRISFYKRVSQRELAFFVNLWRGLGGDFSTCDASKFPAASIDWIKEEFRSAYPSNQPDRRWNSLCQSARQLLCESPDGILVPEIVSRILREINEPRCNMPVMPLKRQFDVGLSDEHDGYEEVEDVVDKNAKRCRAS